MDFFDAELIQARLRDPQFGFETVSGAADYAAVEKLSSFRPGTVYVVLMAERNDAGDAPQARYKTAASVTFGVIVVARNYRGQTGEAALQDVKPLVGNVRRALLGWPPAGCTPCVWLQGDVLDYDRSNLLWADVFTTTHILGGQP